MELAKDAERKCCSGLIHCSRKKFGTHKLIRSINRAFTGAKSNLCLMNSVGVDNMEQEVGGMGTVARKARVPKVYR